MDLKNIVSFGNVKVGAHFSVDEATVFPLVKKEENSSNNIIAEAGADFIKLSIKTARPVLGNNDTIFSVKSTEPVVASCMDIPGPPKGEETVLAQKLREAGLLDDEVDADDDSWDFGWDDDDDDFEED